MVLFWGFMTGCGGHCLSSTTGRDTECDRLIVESFESLVLLVGDSGSEAGMLCSGMLADCFKIQE